MNKRWSTAKSKWLEKVLMFIVMFYWDAGTDGAVKAS